MLGGHHQVRPEPGTCGGRLGDLGGDGEGIAELRTALVEFVRKREKTGEGMFLLPEEMAEMEQAGEALSHAMELILSQQEELAAEELRQLRGRLHFGPAPGAPVADITQLMAGFCLGK